MKETKNTDLLEQLMTAVGGIDLAAGVQGLLEWEAVIYSLPFSIELFRLLPYSPSLEVIIEADGTILYARPSHTEVLIRLAMERNHCTREELTAMCPPEYYFNYIDWLCIQSGECISVWENFFLGASISAAQKAALESLGSAGLYFGTFSQYED